MKRKAQTTIPSGLCECGCGGLVMSPDKRGRTRRFINGHNRRGISLRGENSPGWKGGKIIENGYALIWKPDHPFANSRGYIMQHRLVMEEYLGRYLDPEEISHHIDEVKDHNWIGNLELCLDSIHKSFHNLTRKLRQ